jgi:hypothetical protein
MATRYCGNLRIRIRLLADSVSYRCNVSLWVDRVRSAGWVTYTCVVDAPASGYGTGIAYDSPEAYDRTAHAAVSFGSHDLGSGDNWIDDNAELTDSGWLIRRKEGVTQCFT